jgi:hypothetical protein
MLTIQITIFELINFNSCILCDVFNRIIIVCFHLYRIIFCVQIIFCNIHYKSIWILFTWIILTFYIAKIDGIWYILKIYPRLICVFIIDWNIYLLIIFIIQITHNIIIWIMSNCYYTSIINHRIIIRNNLISI